MNRRERQKKLFEKLEKYGPTLKTKCRPIRNSLGDFLIPFLYHVESFAIDILKEERDSMISIEILVKNTQGKEFIHKFELPFPMYENMPDSDIKTQY